METPRLVDVVEAAASATESENARNIFAQAIDDLENLNQIKAFIQGYLDKKPGDINGMKANIRKDVEYLHGLMGSSESKIKMWEEAMNELLQ